MDVNNKLNSLLEQSKIFTTSILEITLYRSVKNTIINEAVEVIIYKNNKLGSITFKIKNILSETDDKTSFAESFIICSLILI